MAHHHLHVTILLYLNYNELSTPCLEELADQAQWYEVYCKISFQQKLGGKQETWTK